MPKYFGGVTTDGIGFVAIKKPFSGTSYLLEDGSTRDLSGLYWKMDTWDLQKEDYDRIRATYLERKEP